jgi:hypothetical protein
MRNKKLLLTDFEVGHLYKFSPTSINSNNSGYTITADNALSPFNNQTIKEVPAGGIVLCLEITHVCPYCVCKILYKEIVGCLWIYDVKKYPRYDVGRRFKKWYGWIEL